MLPMPPRVAAVRARITPPSLSQRPPETFTLDHEDFDAVEDYLQAVKDERIREWKAAGSPEEWHTDLSPLYVGKHFGLMFKGVELIRR